MTASNAALEEYGLPTRPDPATGEEFLFWALMLSPPRNIIRADFPENLLDGQPEFFQTRHALELQSLHRTRQALEKSKNWSGAVAVPPGASRFARVNGGWQVPMPSVPTVLPDGAVAGNQEYRSSTWVGLGGHQPHDGASLPQIGTSQFIKDTGGAPIVTLGAWWQWWVKGEMYGPVEITNFPISYNDTILASVRVRTVNNVEKAFFHIKNQTTGLFTNFLVDPPQGNLLPLGPSAEWIMERPTVMFSTDMYLLPHCTDVSFRNCSARAMSAGGPQTLNLDNARLIRMVEIFPNPKRPGFVSQPQKTGSLTARVSYHEGGI